MKTLVITCASCIFLSGALVAVKYRDEVKKLLTLSKSFDAFPSSTASHRPKLDAETSLAPVETLPSQNNTLFLNKDIAIAPVESKTELLSNILIDSNWMDNPAADQGSAAAAGGLQPVTPPEDLEEENSLAYQVPFREEDLADIELVIETRHLIMNLLPEKEDSVHKPAPASVKGMVHATSVTVEQ